MITIECISHFAAAVVTALNRYTCLLHWLIRCSPMGCGDIKVFVFVAPSSTDGCLPVMCESQNFESIFPPPAILHTRPRPQLHVSPSHHLRHVTKPTVICMTDFFRFDTRILIRKRGNITTYNLGGDRCWPEIKADCIRHRRMASMAISATLGVMHKQ